MGRNFAGKPRMPKGGRKATSGDLTGGHMNKGKTTSKEMTELPGAPRRTHTMSPHPMMSRAMPKPVKRDEARDGIPRIPKDGEDDEV